METRQADAIFAWLESSGSWTEVETDFYEQHEFSLLDSDLPDDLRFLISDETMAGLIAKFCDVFQVGNLEMAGVVAHKLVEGQHIGIHNDFIGPEESHRLVIQFNPNWQDAHGGFLMLFHSGRVEEVAKLIRPFHNTAFGFEISERSHHAVSKIHEGVRYSIVYTFRIAS